MEGKMEGEAGKTERGGERRKKNCSVESGLDGR